MFTFLRKIRRSFIDSGSTSKYLLYAIGEIALVVIGILIALQINNWNEGRKNVQEGIRYVHLIHKDLVKEYEVFQYNIERLISQNKGAYDLLEAYERASGPIDEEVFSKAMSATYTPINLEREKLTWDDLVSSGNVDIIRDDSLTQLLKSFYHSYDLDIITFNKAPESALFEFQRLTLRNIDLNYYDKVFNENSEVFMDQEKIKQLVSQKQFNLLLREIVVGSKVVTMALQGLSTQLLDIIAYIEGKYGVQ